MNPNPFRDPLPTLLGERALLEPRHLLACLERAQSAEQALSELLIGEEIFTRAELLAILENHFFCPSSDLDAWEYEPSLLKRIPQRVAYQHRVFPVAHDGQTLAVAFVDPDDKAAQAAVAQLVGGEVSKRVALASDLSAAIERHYGRFFYEGEEQRSKSKTGQKRSKEQLGFESKQWSAKLAEFGATETVDTVLAEALRSDATDLHFEQREAGMIIRMRIDGMLHQVANLSTGQARTVVSRLKVISGMDIADRRLPQDGRASVTIGKQQLDLRLSSLPAQFGEKIVVRLLRKNVELLDLDRLGMPPAVRLLHEDMLTNPLGIYLVTGPTGSGKTTTLYATLRALDRENLNVVTLEDPIEYSFDDLTQVQINEDIGLTFESGLKSILRQDPDVILLGEIRNAESLEVACRASLTGHKVFSTLHTNDATQAVTRLIEMGTPPYLITATLKAVIAQRLLRKICSDCKQAYTPNDTERAILGYAEVDQLYSGTGCVQCGGSGYRGRMALYEVFKLEDNLHRLIIERVPAQVLRHAAERNGMIPMSQFAIRAVLDGHTTVSEIQRVVLSDDSKETLCTHCQRVVSNEFSVCPFCEHVLKESCSGCGCAVEASWGACPSCGTEIERDWQRVYCSSCVAPLDPSWGGCPYCGESRT